MSKPAFLYGNVTRGQVRAGIWWLYLNAAWVVHAATAGRAHLWKELPAHATTVPQLCLTSKGFLQTTGGNASQRLCFPLSHFHEAELFKVWLG